MDFRSDNTAAAAPEILAAVAAANAPTHASSYGEDALSKRLTQAFCTVFDADVEVFVTATGTAANALSLAALVPPWGAVLCHREAHIETDECGAPEFFTHGAKLVLVDGPAARITPDGLHAALRRHRRGVHSVHASALSLTNATERGTTYAPDAVAELSGIAHAAGLGVHMDGARFANAVVHRGCTPAALTWQAGVDVLSFGATKNGALGAEAIVVFNRGRVGDIARLRKRSGHLLSKHRYVAAQLLAYLDDGLWLRLAARANAAAQRIADAAGDWLSHPCEANSVFIRPGAPVLGALRDAGVGFYDWGELPDEEARLVVSWCQDPAEVSRLAALLRRLRG
jgi:threonine aldolase